MHHYIHQTFQLPKIEALTYMSCMDTAYVTDKPTPKIAVNKVQETLHFRYLKFLVILLMAEVLHQLIGSFSHYL